MEPFRNEPVLELRRAPVRDGLAAALASLDAELPLRVGGDAIVSVDPCRSDRVVATAAAASPADVDAALDAATHAAGRWRDTPASERAAALLKAAAYLRQHRLRAAALALRECGKPWPEADADVCEAIDFLEYYARGAVELDRGAELLQVPGERNALRYAPRGVVAVIAPWNFPVAIPLGMAAAGLATGNTVVLKPAEQAPGCASLLAAALAHLPEGVFQVLTGEGDVGAALVADPRVHTIAFTGSGPVGLEIVRSAAEVRDGQRHLKRVVAEMGGKNCLIVDSDADLDEVVPAVISSAFTYAGQKCSAAARVLAHRNIHDALLERLAGAVGLLEVAPAERPSVDVPAVIEAASLERHARYVAMAARDGRVVAAVDDIPGGGFYAAPTLVADLPADHELLRTEVFAPLLAVERVRDVNEACDRVDASPFALTGGLFSRNPDVVDAVVRRSPVGNLYVNRSITGAMVARQPFGGNRLSGTGTKAGGPGYLLQFVEPRVVTENTMRHGLVV
ncbi:MAG: RHH-type transcriptional regulator, proline utilization regulon repressor / proline dehydrogenase [Solirubrobacteraceae bacterium]|jgi:RHH-type proline utilization regulon transcriptional repressor/proline dehydrogenase/delta 1-pyrroline-5-carboxylate dehydrogenase|nr:RHH-type transcriptional regulator, proline utilization regulon repressor / proline dehydrogenase [Solirubrobacteraceae bacterium]